MENILSEIASMPLLYLIIITSILLCILIGITIKKLFLSNYLKLPPGPKPIPIFGNTLQMGNNFHLTLSKWANQYGKLCTIYLGTKQALLISDPKYMKEIFGTFASTGKFKTVTIELVSQGPYGIVGSEGKTWAEQRLFFMKSMKTFGFGKSMEPIILDECSEVCNWVQKGGVSPVILQNVLSEATVNILWTLVSGETFKIGESQVAQLINRWVKAANYTVKSGLGVFPWLKYLAPGLSGFNIFDKACKDIHDLVRENFKKHELTYVDGIQRDVIDMYIEKMKNAETEQNETSAFYQKVGMSNSVASIVEIFLAGGETSSTTLNWSMVYMALNQGVQQKLLDEIDQVIGKERDPSLSDKNRMPYTEALLLETLRSSSLIPVGVIQRLLEDIKFQEYIFPKDMLLVPNMYHIHHNSEIWGDPEIFRPERFLENEGLKEFLVPFQAGRRQCFGEPIAMDILFLIVTKLIQQFHVTLDPNVEPEEYLKCEVGLVLLPKHLGLVMTPRK